MGLFGKKVPLEVLELRDNLIGKRPNRDTALAIVLVDCRFCAFPDHAVLVNETVWGVQTCKASYSYCKANRDWVAETQGSGLAGKSAEGPSRTPWSVFSNERQEATWFDGLDVPVFSRDFESILDWVLEDFQNRITGTKLIAQDFIRSKNDPEWLKKLETFVREDPIDD